MTQVTARPFDSLTSYLGSTLSCPVPAARYLSFEAAAVTLFGATGISARRSLSLGLRLVIAVGPDGYEARGELAFALRAEEGDLLLACLDQMGEATVEELIGQRAFKSDRVPATWPCQCVEWWRDRSASNALGARPEARKSRMRATASAVEITEVSNSTT